jgi:hypothetical protein
MMGRWSFLLTPIRDWDADGWDNWCARRAARTAGPGAAFDDLMVHGRPISSTGP